MSISTNDWIASIKTSLSSVSSCRVTREIDEGEFPLGICDYDFLEGDFKFLLENDAPETVLKAVAVLYRARCEKLLKPGDFALSRRVKRLCRIAHADFKTWAKGKEFHDPSPRTLDDADLPAKWLEEHSK